MALKNSESKNSLRTRDFPDKKKKTVSPKTTRASIPVEVPEKMGGKIDHTNSSNSSTIAREKEYQHPSIFTTRMGLL
ncbi:hypothetical protein CEXT_460351 [Caerostris extrusa]|uniref:Uncharacterized protein n=1 Tax=Caerostris extrusa TaxID=172846 RepID=A0AAV4MYC7_CAEEX|nr:hypothetical protein CEXT_460351 [Caerostris extrusa]